MIKTKQSKTTAKPRNFTPRKKCGVSPTFEVNGKKFKTDHPFLMLTANQLAHMTVGDFMLFGEKNGYEVWLSLDNVTDAERKCNEAERKAQVVSKTKDTNFISRNEPIVVRLTSDYFKGVH